MRGTRPVVLHGVRDLVRPSERFVLETVAATTRTRPVVVCERRWPGLAAEFPGPVREVGPLAGALPARARPRATRWLVTAIASLHRAALLHAHFGYWAAPVAAAARRLDRPWVVSLHGHDLLVEAARSPGSDVLKRADLVAVPSRFLADAATRFGLPAERVRVLPSGVDLAALPFRERAPRPDGSVVVTFAGRFVAKKDPLSAARVLVELHRRRPSLRAVFVGTGPLEEDLRRLLADSALPATVLDGAAPGALRAALADTDLLLTPSRTAPDGDAETLGLVNIEAQACGVPVVSTRHGGIPEAVAPDAGVLVPEDDEPALLAALERLVDAPERWAAMGRAGRAFVATRFALADRVAALESAYLELLARRQ